jgi:hypothetical protein
MYALTINQIFTGQFPLLHNCSWGIQLRYSSRMILINNSYSTISYHWALHTC